MRRTSKNGLVGIAAVLLVGGMTPAATAQQQGRGGRITTASPPRVTMEAKGKTRAEVLAKLFEGTGFTYRDRAPAQPDTKLSVSLQNTPFEEGLWTVLHLVRPPLVFRKLGDVYEIRPQEPVSLNVTDRNVRQALAEIFEQAGVKYALGEDVTGTVTLQLKDRPLDEALDRVVRAASVPLAWRWSRGTYEVTPRTANDSGAQSNEKSGENVMVAKSRTFAVEANNADVRQVLQKLFRDADVSGFSIADNVRGTLTITFKDKSLEEALGLITRITSPPLTWTRSPEGFYEVRLRSVRRVGALTNEEMPPPPAIIARADTMHYEMIPLMYADARDIVAALQALRPDGLTAALAYVPLNRVITRWDGSGTGGAAGGAAGGFVSGAFGPGAGNNFGMRPPGAPGGLPGGAAPPGTPESPGAPAAPGNTGNPGDR